MLSNDKNIETVSQLIEMVKHNIELRTEYVRLDIVEKVVRLLSAAALAVLLTILLLVVLLFASLSLAHWLTTCGIGLPVAYLCVAGLYLLLLLIVYAARKSWIERPLVKYLSRLLLN